MMSCLCLPGMRTKQCAEMLMLILNTQKWVQNREQLNLLFSSSSLFSFLFLSNHSESTPHLGSRIIGAKLWKLQRQIASSQYRDLPISPLFIVRASSVSLSASINLVKSQGVLARRRNPAWQLGIGSSPGANGETRFRYAVSHFLKRSILST